MRSMFYIKCLIATSTRIWKQIDQEDFFLSSYMNHPNIENEHNQMVCVYLQNKECKMKLKPQNRCLQTICPQHQHRKFSFALMHNFKLYVSDVFQCRSSLMFSFSLALGLIQESSSKSLELRLELGFTHLNNRHQLQGVKRG